MKFIKKYKVFIVFSILFLLVFLQHNLLTLYHDDYANLSLSYAGIDVGNSGHYFTFKQMCNFLFQYYMVWGGRVLYLFVLLIIFKLGGLFLFKIVQSLVITFIFYLIYKIVVSFNPKNKILPLIFSFLMYGTMEIMVFRSGVFWMAASVLYLFPILPFLLFIYLYCIKKSNNILCGFLIFISAFSQEQIGMMAVSFLIFYIIIGFVKKRKIDRNNLYMLICSLVGFGCLMLAPGNYVRMNGVGQFNEFGIINKVMYTLPNIIVTLFSGDTKIFSLLFFGICIYVSYLLINKNMGNRYLNYVSLVSNTIIFSLSIYFNDGYFKYFSLISNNRIFDMILYSIFIIQFGLIIYDYVIYFIKTKNYILLCTFISSLCSIGVMIISSYFPFRSTMPFYYMSLIIIVYFLSNVSNKKINGICVAIIGCLFITNYLNIYLGYLDNDKINKYNDKIMSKATISIKNKNKNYIKLKKLNNDTYTNAQYYISDTYLYIKNYMYNYYNIPDNIELIYE